MREKTGYPIPLVKKVWAEAVKQGVSPTLAVSLVAHESRFNSVATNNNGDGSKDWGLFQLNSRYHPQFRLNVDQHIAYGVKLVGDYVRRYGTLAGLGYYNAGFGKTPAVATKQKAYVGKVLGEYQLTQKALAGYEKIDPTFKMSPWGDADKPPQGGQ